MNETTNATHLSGSVIINAPREEVWDTVKYIEDIADFHPLVNESRLTNSLEGVGAKRYCALKPMGAMEEQVTEWCEGEGFTMQVVGGKMLPPYDFMIGKLVLESLENRTQATFTFSYRLKFGLLGRMMNKLLVKPQFRGAPVKYVKGLKAYVERS